MVRLMNAGNVKYFMAVTNGILKTQEIFTLIKGVSHPNVGPCVYAIWHGNQCSIYGLPNRGNVNVLISNSLDGTIIGHCVGNLGLKVVRGSTGRKGAVEGTLKLVEALKKGESAALMIDGPRGPAKVVKDGVIKLAQLANVPIVPVHWYSPQFNFVKFKSWDSMVMPIGYCRIINLYGEPIYVPQELGAGDEKFYKEKIKQSLLDLEEKAPAIYKEVKNEIPWKLNLDLDYPHYS